jgi:streptogramin lyase
VARNISYVRGTVVVLLVMAGLYASLSRPISVSTHAQAVQRKGASGIAGTARNAAGKPLEGVVVSAKATDSTITTSVFTDENGAYVFPFLPAGVYRVWAQAVGFATAKASLSVGDGLAERAFTLKTLDDFTQQLSGSDWMNALPEDSREDRRLKAIVAANCMECHSVALAFQNRLDARSWVPILERMYAAPHTPGAYHREEIARYFEKVRGPGAPPLSFKLQPRPTGDAARVVITQYDVPAYARSHARNDGSDWMEGQAAGGGPHDNVVDNNGMVWMTEGATSPEQRESTLTRLNPQTGQVTAIRVYAPNGKTLVGSHGIERDQKGSLWFDAFDGMWQPGNLGRIDPSTGTAEVFSPPANMSTGMNVGTDVDGHGKVWSATSYGAIRFDPDTRRFDYYRGHTTATLTYGIAGDSEGNGWWTQYDVDQVAKADVKTGKVYEVKIEPPDAKELKSLWTDRDRAFYESVGVFSWGSIARVPGGQEPRRMAADHNGDSVWVPAYISNYLVQINVRTLATKYYPVPVKGNPYEVRVDARHNVWVSLGGDDRVLKFEPASEKWTTYRLPNLGCNARDVSIDDARNEVWVPCYRASVVMRLQFRTPQQVQARQAELLQAAR